MKRILLSAVIPIIAFASCGFHLSLSDENNSFKLMDSRSEELTIPAENASKLDLNVNVGSVSISYENSSDIVIKADFISEGMDKDKMSAQLEGASLDQSVKKDTLRVRIIDPEVNDDDVTLRTDLDIELPKGFSDFTINDNVGDIEVNDLSGKFCIKANVGCVDMKKVSPSKDSLISSNVGNIDVSFSEISKCDLDIKLGVGDVKIKTGGHDFTEKDNTKNNSVGSDVKYVIDDKLKISASVNVGNSKISK